MTALAFTGSSTSQLSFQDGYCPEEYYHDGSNQTVYIKNIGAKKNLSIRDIKHSAAVAGMGLRINQLVGGFPSGEGLPGGDGASFAREFVRDGKEKEVRLSMTLVLNGWDRLLVDGSTLVSSLEFDGIEQWATNMSCTMHTNSNTASGTFSAASFDQFLYEGCAKPTMIFGNGLEVVERVPLVIPPTATNLGYLTTKREKLGHLIQSGSSPRRRQPAAAPAGKQRR